MKLFKTKVLTAALTFALSQPAIAGEFKVTQQAKDLANKYIIIDGHIDVPYRLEEHYDDVSKATKGGDFDYPRAKQGGLDAPFMSIYIPAKLEGTGKAKPLANQLIDRVEAMVGRAPEKFALAHSLADVKANHKAGKVSLPMGMENGSPIEGDLENLNHFYQRGIRYITLAHSKSNHISDSSYDTNRHWHGLSDFGKELVVAMNNIGVMVDVSHISDDAFYQVMDITKVPVIASHSSLRHFVPGFERNMSDEMLKALKKNGGVIQINFGSSFITKEANVWYDTMDAAKTAYNKKHNINDGGHHGDNSFEKSYLAKHPFPFANIDNVLDHIDRVVKIAGIDYVGLGSDYDGVGNSLPTNLKDVASYPNLIQGMLNRGYSEADIAKVLGGNVMRVWQAVEQYAATH